MSIRGTIDILNKDSVYFCSDRSCKRAARSFLFLPLLIGLLFSGGEGITLLPFPDAATGPGVRNIGQSAPSREKQVDVDKTESTVQIKLQARDIVQQAGGCAATALSLGDNSASDAGAVLVCGRPYAEITSRPTSISGRAPPISESV